jgi:integrase
MLCKRDGSANWYYKFTISGKTIFRTTGTTDKGQAEEIAANAYATTFRQVRMGEKPRYLWQEAVVRFLNEGKQKKSQKTEKDHFRWLSKHLDVLYIDQIDHDRIEKLITAKLKETGTTRCNRMTGTVSAVLGKAIKQWGWLDGPMPYIRKFKEHNQRLRWLSHEEADRLLAELKPHTKAMVIFSLATGLRESNVTGLEWSQIDLQRQILWIHGDQSKNGKTIRVPLNNDAIAVLTEQRVLRVKIGLKHNRVLLTKASPLCR